jgi:putative addiction module component (TIGR02574 family)
MTAAVEQLKARFMTLSSPERAELATFLLSSLEPEEEGAEDAWQTEIARRVADILAGTASGRPAEEVLGEMRSRYQ